MVIAAGAPPTVLPAAVKPPVPVTFTGALIAAKICACDIPVTRFTVWPLIVNAPLFTSEAGTICVPVSDALASGESVAPNPVIFAGDGEPATGLAEKVFGSISSEPGTFASCAVVSG